MAPFKIMSTQKEISARFYKRRKENGLCPRCGKPLDREGYYCSECLEKVRVYHRENREFYRKNHLCTECGKNSVPEEERICPECRAKRANLRKSHTDEQKKMFREKQNSLYMERVEQGICTRCGKRKAISGKKKCGICLAKDAEIHRKKYADRPNIREYRKENNLCYFCGDPIDLHMSNTCSKCREKFKKIASERTHDNDYWRKDNRFIFRSVKNE